MRFFAPLSGTRMHRCLVAIALYCAGEVCMLLCIKSIWLFHPCCCTASPLALRDSVRAKPLRSLYIPCLSPPPRPPARDLPCAFCSVLTLRNISLMFHFISKTLEPPDMPNDEDATSGSQRYSRLADGAGIMAPSVEIRLLQQARESARAAAEVGGREDSWGIWWL